MQLGVVLTAEDNRQHAEGLLAAAAARGWSCRCFLTDRGVRLLMSDSFLRVIRTGAVKLDVCELSWERYGAGAPPPEATMGGQYQDAELVHLSDRVLVL